MRKSVFFEAYDGLEGKSLSDMPRKDKFLDRYESLLNGEFRRRSPSKIRDQIRCDFANAMKWAKRYKDADDARFLYSVARAEVYAQILYELEVA
jgi:DNA transposition AAA+ family ATPase